MQQLTKDVYADKLLNALFNLREITNEIERETEVVNIPVALPFIRRLIGGGCHSFCKYYAEFNEKCLKCLDEGEVDDLSEELTNTHCKSCIVWKIDTALNYGDDPEAWADITRE